MIPKHLLKYVKYIDIQPSYCSSRNFDDDFAPIGGTVRQKLVDLGLCLEEDEVIIVTQAVHEELKNND